MTESSWVTIIIMASTMLIGFVVQGLLFKGMMSQWTTDTSRRLNKAEDKLDKTKEKADCLREQGDCRKTLTDAMKDIKALLEKNLDEIYDRLRKVELQVELEKKDGDSHES